VDATITKACAADGTWMGPEPICGKAENPTTMPDNGQQVAKAPVGGAGRTSATDATTSMGTNITITDLPADFDSFSTYFDKYISLFDGVVSIIGSKKCTQTMPDNEGESVMIHAAKIFAEYIDGNRDGEPDNTAVATALGESHSATTITMFGSQHDIAMIRQRFPISPKRHYHDLECDETPAGGECSGEPEECFDNAHCELVQVLINQGFAQVFPEIFAPSYGVVADDDPDDDKFPELGTHSVTAVNMGANVGDCGYAFNGTLTYPNCTGMYHYSDKTCGFSCLVSEYNYWSLTAILGGQEATAGRCDLISEEWELCTPEEMAEGDPAQYSVMTNTSYGLPTIWPLGGYS